MPEDLYWPTPQLDYDQRKALYLEYCAAQTPGPRLGLFSQLARLELGRGPLDEASILEGIAFVDSRQDCCDFAAGGLLRILYRYSRSPLISRELVGKIEDCLLRFKYWWDEPGDNKRCYWTENHQIIFHSDELLAGQLFMHKTFQNDGKKGQDHIAHALHLIRRWIHYRVRFGFSEWLSNCYFEEDLMALVNLYDFARQEDVRRQAGMLIDLILFEMALHTYRGVMGCSHGRTYAFLILGGRREGSASTAKMAFGMGLFNSPPALGAVSLSTSFYRPPALIEKIAQQLDQPVLSRERHSFNVDDAPEFGLSYDDLADANLYWSVQDYTHEKILALSLRLSETFQIWLDREQYLPRYAQVLKGQEEKFGRVIDPNVDCHAMTEVHIQTYRTGNYMLSCAQDYRPGKPGYQQHPWQATLGIDAVVFSNHPGSDNITSRPNYWAGNGILPRAAQHHNVLICLHLVWPGDAFPFSHAYFPRDAFDEVVERNQWICARKERGYIALYASKPYHWLADENGRDVEVRVDSTEVAWICELGEEGQWPDFASFVGAVTSARVVCQGLQVAYTSPSQGQLLFGWEDELQIDGEIVPLHNYPRFDNPYCRCDFDTRKVTIRYMDEEIALDFETSPES